MDLYCLQNALREISPFFWGPDMEAQLRDSGYPRKTPQESAYYRYIIALRRESDKPRITGCVNSITVALYPYDETVRRRLAEIAEGPIPQGQLATFFTRVKDFDGISVDNYQEVIEVVVCLAHPQFLTDLDHFIVANAQQEQVTSTPRGKGMGERAEGGRKLIVGDTLNLGGFSIQWRNAISRFQSLSRWKKLAAVVVVVVLVLAFFARATWLPFVHRYAGTEKGEQNGEDPVKKGLSRGGP